MAGEQTHLGRLEQAERWQVWDDAKELVVAKDSAGNRVALSRWDVHTMLESATEAAFSSPGAGGAGVPEQVFVRSPSGAGTVFTEVVVQRPQDAGQWISELVGFATAHSTSSTRCYQVGPWIVQVGSPDYYAYIYGATSPELIGSYSDRGHSYQAMCRSSSSCDDRTGVMMGFLKNDPLRGVPAEMARLTVAMCVSEATRNFRAWGTNLMLLDLLRGNVVKGGLESVIMDGMHPMAKGSTFDPGSTGMKGGRKSRETWSHETCITMMWLKQYSAMSFELYEGRERRWRDPVKGEAHRSTVRRKLTKELLGRMRKLGFAWE
jgi:hypothetical protein